MIIWRSLRTVTFALQRAIASFFQPPVETQAGGPAAQPSDRSVPKNGDDLEHCPDPKFGLAVALLTRIRDALSGHSEEMVTFAQALGPTTAGSALPAAARASMQAANQMLEEMVESTVHRLTLVSGSLLLTEQSRLKAYQDKTNAFSKKLGGIPAEVVMTHVVAELLGAVQDLRRENENARSEMANAQKKLRQLAARASAAEREARTDALTKLLNRRAFDEIHSTCHAASQDFPYSLVMLDVDRFKSINDEFGHPAGDAVLALIGRVMRENCRAADHMARWGGEEFAILMPGINVQMALGVAERLRRKAEAAILHYGPSAIRFTVSCGIVQSHPDISPTQTLEEADLALFAAKGQGRNRSVVYEKHCRVQEQDMAATAV